MTTSSSGISQFYIPDSRIAFISKVKASLQSKKIVAIEGSEGIGKTALLEEVLTSTLPDANKCYVTTTQSMNDIQVRSRIIEQLFGNVLFDPEMPLLTSFIEFNQPSEILIAIDNCHFLSGRVIGELLQLFGESQNLGIDLTLVLAFNRSLSSTLMNVNSGFLQVLTVPSLNKQESYQLMAEYIPDLPAQTNIKVKRWIENSGGLPIQLLAFSENKTLEPSDNSPLNLKFWVALMVMASLLLTIGIYVYRLNVSSEAVKQELQPSTSESLLKQQVVKPWQSPSQGVDNQKEDDDLLGSNVLDNETVTEQAEAEFSLDEKPMAQMVATPTASSELIFDALMKDKAIEEPTDNASDKTTDAENNTTTDMMLAELAAEKEQREQQLQAELSNNERPINNVSSNENQGETVDELDSLTSDADASLDFFLEPEERNESTSLQSAEEEVDATLNDGSQNAEGIISTPTEMVGQLDNGTSYRIDNQQFMALPATHYVLQLTAVSSHAVLAEYLMSAPVPVEKLRIYKISRNQTDWIVVTHGLFNSIEQAREEAKRIAPNAWAKSISVIQQQITAYQKTLENQ